MRLPSALLACSLALTGCVLSIDAVVPESSAAFDPRLLGAWEEVGGSDRAVVTRDSGGSYTIAYTDDKGTAQLRARLGRLGPRLVLDVWPAKQEDQSEGPATDLMVPGHVLLALELAGDSAVVAALDPDTLLAAARSRALRLASTEAGNQLVLLGRTDELRSGLTAYMSRPHVWGRPGVYRHPIAASPPSPVEPPCFEAAAWREADRLFHRDPHWVGADVGSTVDLGNGRTLWLFGDSWIDTSGHATRRGARMISNTLGIQTGTDPSTATMAFYWGRKADGGPDAFFPDRRGERLWFGSGARAQDRLVLFMGRVISVPTGLGFASAGWTAFLVENPDDAPSAWRTREIPTPPNPLGITPGTAGAWQDSGYVYAFGNEDPVKSHPTYLVRWREADVRAGDLLHPEWWANDRLGWVPDSSSTPRWPIFENGGPEVSIHFDRASGRYVEVQTLGFGAADVMMRAAPRLTGPWTSPRMIYRPPEYYRRPGVMIYAAKSHPTLTGADLVLTYATNAFDPVDLVTDSLIYYPRFVRLTRCR
jgi:hypothetical protein